MQPRECEWINVYHYIILYAFDLRMHGVFLHVYFIFSRAIYSECSCCSVIFYTETPFVIDFTECEYGFRR